MVDVAAGAAAALVVVSGGYGRGKNVLQQRLSISALAAVTSVVRREMVLVREQTAFQLYAVAVTKFAKRDLCILLHFVETIRGLGCYIFCRHYVLILIGGKTDFLDLTKCGGIMEFKVYPRLLAVIFASHFFASSM